MENKNSKYALLFIGIVIIVAGVALYQLVPSKEQPVVENNDVEENILLGAEQYKDLLIVETPLKGSKVTSPLMVKGRARGTWYFEASAPVFVVDWNGQIIGEGYMQATGDWMTEEYVPFEGTIEFDATKIQNGYSDKGTIIFKKDNPSGLPENDDAFEMPVIFE